MAKKVAILQSNYIPWKGYFDLINSVDEFILYDDVQFTRRDWRNRNKIKTPQGIVWLTIPVKVKDRYYQKIKETEVSSTTWAASHWKTLQYNYARAPFFDTYAPTFAEIYDQLAQETLLSRINFTLLKAICGILGIRTQLSWSMDYELVEGKTERLVNLCQQAGGDTYLSGPAAQDYLQPEIFEQAGITLAYYDYSGYPEYPQLFPPFEHSVSILDLLLNVGPDAPRYMKSYLS